MATERSRVHEERFDLMLNEDPVDLAHRRSGRTRVTGDARRPLSKGPKIRRVPYVRLRRTGLALASAFLAVSSFATTAAATAVPTITSFAPTSGPVGTSVTITGMDLADATDVTIGGIAVPTADLTIDSDTQITVKVPRGAVTGSITVTTPGGSGSSTLEFTVDSARPNILLIISDDQAWSTFNRELMPSAYGQLVDQGMLFTRAYVNDSLCCPSRSQILTGLFEHHTGVDSNSVPLTRPTIVQALHDTGYRTMLSGKYLNSWPCAPRPEFDQWVCGGSPWPGSYKLVNPWLNVNGTWTQFTGIAPQIQANFVTDFIQGTAPTQPFFVIYSPTTPHVPANDPRYSSMPVTPLRSPSYDEETLTEGKPLYMREPPLTSAARQVIDSTHAAMSRSVRGLDDDVASILSSLGGREDNTIVFYLSDNGYLYGEHRRSGKLLPYEESVRVPFVVRDPALLPPDRRSVSDALVQNVDIAPTIAELVGIPWSADGRSLVPLLDGSASSIRDGVLIQRREGDTGARERTPLRLPAFSGVVTSSYAYLEYDTGETELYDLVQDPYELVNLAADPAHADVQSQLAIQLALLRVAPAPDTTIVTGPQGALHSRVAPFSYFSQDRYPTYRCRLTKDGVPDAWHPCNGEWHVEGSLPDGDYAFEVEGTDSTGAADPTPASRSFSIHSTGPPVYIDAAPAPHVRSGSAAFSFASPVAGAAFECRLSRVSEEEGSWSPCDPSVGASYDSLRDGFWSFEVRAIDPATLEVTDPPAGSLVQVDTTGPAMTFTAHPLAWTQDTSARFAFFPDEATAGPLACQLDAGVSEDCSGAGFDLTGLAEGVHTFTVSATDEIGNTGVSTFTWTVDRTPPAASFGRRLTTVSTEGTPDFSCAIDGGPLMACRGALPYGALSDGLHTGTIRAVDLAGNVSDPVTTAWVQSAGTTSGPVAVAVCSILGTSGDDVLVGTPEADVICGLGGDDQLSGDAGGDILVPGAGTGASSVDGGPGMDTLDFADLTTVGVAVDLTSNPPSAADTAGGITVSDTLSSVERVTGTNLDDTLTGDALANVLSGLGGADTISGGGEDDVLHGQGGDDTLSGGDGNDTLHPGAGADPSVDGGPGIDTVSYADMTSGVEVNLDTLSTGGGAETDTLLSIERATGTNSDDTITGDPLANVLSGLGGADTISGGGGDDTVYPGAGTDPSVDGGPGTDTVSYADLATAVVVNLTTLRSGAGAGVDTLTSIENATGTNQDDKLTGDATDNVLTGRDGADKLYGASGNDTLVPGAGNDTVEGMGGIDTVSYSDLSAGVVVNLSVPSTGGAAGSDTLSRIENATGTNSNDTLVGSTTANSLSGKGGHDTLSGGDGNDTLYPGAGADPSVDGGPGGDTVSYADMTSGVTVNLAALSTGGAAGTDMLTSIENAAGTNVDDTLAGSAEGNTLTGGDGADTLTGDAGNDTLMPGAGDDPSVDGGSGVDTVSYSDLSAGVAVDLSVPSTGGAAGSDTLLSIEWATGTIYADAITGDALANVLNGLAGDDTIAGLDADDTLNGDLGTDSLDGGAGTDTCANGETLANCEA